MKYLTYDEYIAMGGTLAASAFAARAAEAQAYIDRYTFRRLTTAAEVPESVKHCMLALVDVLDRASTAQADAVVSSTSNDGVSVSYAVLSPDQMDERYQTKICETVQLWLMGETDGDGTPLLWRGVDHV